MIEHEFSPGNPRCLHCGTLHANHLMKSQPCVPRWSPSEKLYPLPPRRIAAIDDIDTIHARIIELETDRREALNRPAEEEGGVQH